MLTTFGLDVSEEKLVALCKQYGVMELAIFGSRARGDYRADSDVDLLVEFFPEVAIGLIGFSGLIRSFEKLFGHKVDLGSKDTLKPIIRRDVLPDTITIYESDMLIPELLNAHVDAEDSIGRFGPRLRTAASHTVT